MAITQERLDYFARLYCEPLVLIMNFALFQYLCGMYFKRRGEVRVQALLWFGFLGFVSLIPFSSPDMRMFDHLNDVSEACSTMTFLVQITIISRDVNKKVRIRSLKWLTLVGEVLVCCGFAFTIKGFVELFTTDPNLEKLDGLDNVLEDVSLVFIFGFRFYYVVISKGFKWLWENRKMELFLYTLFLTHEYPFLALRLTTGISWESIQALWHRVTMTLCVLQTLKEKIRSHHSGRPTAAAAGQNHHHSSHHHNDPAGHHARKTHASTHDSMAKPAVAIGPVSPMVSDLKTLTRRVKKKSVPHVSSATTTTTGFWLRSLLRHGAVGPSFKRPSNTSGPRME